MVAKVSVECNGPQGINVSVSAQIIMDVSKLKAVIPGAPSKIGGGFKVGGSVKTKLKGEASAEASVKDKLVHGGTSGLLGASGKGSLHGGGFAIYGDKVVGADGEVLGNAGVLCKTAVEGDLGIGKDGKCVLHGNKSISGAGKYSGGASVSVATDEDALAYVEAYGSGNTQDHQNVINETK